MPIGAYLRDDLAFQAWTAGCVLAFAPALVASADASVALVPVCFIPMLAVYFGGRQAALSSYRAHHDALTGLPNRSSLSETLQEALNGAERAGRPLAVMLLDLDDFKSINDTLGHELGDLTLQRVARRLRQAVGESTVLARIGGDEFAVLVEGPQARGGGGRRAAARARSTTRSRWTRSRSTSAPASASRCFPQHGRTAPELIRHADVAMYCAKGSDAAFQTYAEEDDEYSIDRLALAAQLRRGIERGELVVHYQPKVPLKGGATLARRGARALEPSAARLHRPGRVHPARRADRDHQAAHREGAGGRARAVQALAPRGPRGDGARSTCRRAACSTTTC